MMPGSNNSLIKTLHLCEQNTGGLLESKIIANQQKGNNLSKRISLCISVTHSIWKFYGALTHYLYILFLYEQMAHNNGITCSNLILYSVHSFDLSIVYERPGCKLCQRTPISANVLALHGKSMYELLHKPQITK